MGAGRTRRASTGYARQRKMEAVGRLAGAVAHNQQVSSRRISPYGEMPVLTRRPRFPGQALCANCSPPRPVAANSS